MSGFTDGMRTSKSDRWRTPLYLFDPLNEVFRFTFDPACTTESCLCDTGCMIDNGDDGLSEPWTGNVFLNPPYGSVVGDWMRKAVTEMEEGNPNVIVALIKHAHDTRWFKESVLNRGDFICMLDKRVKFYLDGVTDESQSAPTFPSTLAIYCDGLLSSQVETLKSLGTLIDLKSNHIRMWD